MNGPPIAPGGRLFGGGLPLPLPHPHLLDLDNISYFLLNGPVLSFRALEKVTGGLKWELVSHGFGKWP